MATTRENHNENFDYEVKWQNVQTSNDHKIKANQSQSHVLGVLRAISLPNDTSTASQGQLQIGPPVTAGRPSLRSPFPSKSQNQKTHEITMKSHCIAVGIFSRSSHDSCGYARKAYRVLQVGSCLHDSIAANKYLLPIEYGIGTWKGMKSTHKAAMRNNTASTKAVLQNFMN